MAFNAMYQALTMANYEKRGQPKRGRSTEQFRQMADLSTKRYRKPGETKGA